MDFYTSDQLQQLNSDQLRQIILMLQPLAETLTEQNNQLLRQIETLNRRYEQLIEEIRASNVNRYGRKTEKLDVIAGQLSLFNEPEAYADGSAEPSADEVIMVRRRKTRSRGKLDEDLKDIPEELHEHTISVEKLDELYGPGNYRRLPDESYRRLRLNPATWTVEKHIIQVYVGTDGEHQDEFLRADRPKDLIPKSIVTPSLEAAILNGKYINAMPLNRIEQQFKSDGINISRQTMSNWTLYCANRYFRPFYERLKYHLLQCPVNQADETTCTVVYKDGRQKTEKKSWMWVHRSGEFYKDRQIVLYEYQEDRNHEHPYEFYKDFHGILVTDGLRQYQMLDRDFPNITTANCLAHARRHFSDVIKAIGKKNEDAVKSSIAFQALSKLAKIYQIEGELKNMTAEQRLDERQKRIKPLVEDYFAWIKNIQKTEPVLGGKTAKGINYSINQEKYLRVFLTNGDVPIDNSASERSIRPFCVGRKNWVIITAEKGAEASAIIYSVAETARVNNLSTYQYFQYLLTKLPEIVDENGNATNEQLDQLMPWSNSLPDICHRKIN